MSGFGADDMSVGALFDEDDEEQAAQATRAKIMK